MPARFAYEIDAQISDDFAPVTTIVAGPEMANFVFADVL
jgi:hypothetical protein